MENSNKTMVSLRKVWKYQRCHQKLQVF